MGKICRAFFAYSSAPARLAETVEEAIFGINADGGGRVDVHSWRDLKATGKVVIDEICREIKKSDLVLCDLTGLNPNVLFECGFAVAQGKRIWLTVDGTVQKHKENIDLFDGLRSLGYCAYDNDEKIVNDFFREQPFRDLETTLLSQYAGIVQTGRSGSQTDIFYLKSRIEHMASKRLTRFIGSLGRSVVVDDASENRFQPMQWYVSNIVQSRSIIIHMLSDEHSTTHMVENAKYAFYAGMAYGLNRHLLMLAQDPYVPPFDYQDLIVVHSTANECVTAAEKWLGSVFIKGDSVRGAPRSTASRGESEKDAELTLLEIRLGDPVAEYDTDGLSQYFVETGQYHSALQSSVGLFVGRKGTGKTANLLRAAEHFGSDHRNLVVVIKPLAFELEAYVALVEKYFSEKADSHQLAEMLWSFLIYTTIAQDLSERIGSKPFYTPSDEERKLLLFISAHEDAVAGELPERLGYLCHLIDSMVDGGHDAREVFRRLRREHLVPLVEAIKGVLKPYQQVVLLFDNLDKVWEVDRDLYVPGNVVLGLLGFQKVFKKDLEWKKGDARILIFLREDIFDFILKGVAREPDKVLLDMHRITWEDSALLLRVIEERFLASDSTVTRDQVWSKYFDPSIRGVDVREFLVQSVLPKPRDLVYVLGRAIDESINHNHVRITGEDLIRALRTYFEFLVHNTEIELAASIPNVRDMLLVFSGSTRAMTVKEFLRRVRRANTNGADLHDVIRGLAQLPFFGVKRDGVTTFGHTAVEVEQVVATLDSEARRLSSPVRVVIHGAFAEGLGLRT